jgi:hypothetical protein
MNKKALVESNIGKAVLALILLAVIIFIILLAKGVLSDLIKGLKNLLM